MSKELEEILEEYNYYNEEVKLFSADEISSVKDFIPKEWACALCESSTEKKIKGILECWRVLGKELSNTIDYMSENLRDVDLIRVGDKFSLLYSIAAESGDMLYYIGGNPMDSRIEINLPELPETVTAFYKNIHNGFYDYCSKGMGLVESGNISCLGDDEWGILDELEEPLRINLNTSYGLFESGSGGYVVIDVSTGKSALWLHDDQPEYDISFWDVVDDWLVIGFEE